MFRVGVLGLGRVGKLHFLDALHMKGLKVVAIADKSRTNRKVAEKYHKTYEDYTKLVDSEELDAVIISLPNFLKRESIFSASWEGFRYFCF